MPDEPPVAEPVQPGPLPAAEAQVPATPAEAPVDLPTMADVAQLRPGDNIARFVARGVDEGVKRAALKTLFADPHFNVMDGLDTYIDDYGKPDPIPPDVLRRLTQSRTLGLFDDEEAAQAPQAAGFAALPESAAASVPALPDTEPDDAEVHVPSVESIAPDPDKHA